MASVFQKRGSWYLRVKDASGRWTKVRSTAQTKAEAKRLATELEQKSERERYGLDQRPADNKLTLGELCEWWLENRCPTKSLEVERGRLGKHVLRTKLGRVPLQVLTADHVEQQLRDMEKEELGAHSLNGLRGTLFTVFSRARKAKKWTGQNPIADVESRRVPKKVYVTLKPEDVQLLLAEVPDDWRDLFACALYTGMRKGELFGLKKSDVNLGTGLLVVARSYDNATTKSGHEAILPIAKPLVPYLDAALKASKSEYVFPAADGSMRSPELDPEKILRRALGRAGIVQHYLHSCRRCKARKKAHEEKHQGQELRTCPKCSMKMWIKAVPLHMRFHDLRHTTATLLLRSGVPMQHVQRVLRHADIKLTVDTYGHMVVEDIRAAMDSLPMSTRPTSDVVDAEFEILHGDTPKPTQFVPRLSPRGVLRQNEAVGETGFEPATPWSRTKCSTRLSHSPFFDHPTPGSGCLGDALAAARIYARPPPESTTHTRLPAPS